MPRESTAEEVSFERSHHRISPDSKVRTTYQINKIMENTAKEVSCEW